MDRRDSYQVVRTATVAHPAPGATDEARAVIRCSNPTGGPTWIVYRSKGPYVDKMFASTYPTRKAALAALVRPTTQGFNFRTNTPIPAVALRPCSCGSDGSWTCPEHRTANV
jgi:hypothetical protein